MAKGSQTFQKRQRENKLREKAQLKRELRAQRKTEKKLVSESGDLASAEQAISPEGDGEIESGFDSTLG